MGPKSREVVARKRTFFENHSCDPTTWFVDDITMNARRDILPGEEITYDYSTTESYMYLPSPSPSPPSPDPLATLRWRRWCAGVSPPSVVAVYTRRTGSGLTCRSAMGSAGLAI